MTIDTRSLLYRPAADPIKVQKLFQKLGLPRSVRDRIVVGMKKILAPGEVKDRVAAAANVPMPASLDIETFRTEGYARLPGSTIASSARAAKAATRIFEDLRDQGKVQKPQGERKGGFLIRLMGGEALLADENIAGFVLSDEVMELACAYFGEAPVLSSLNFWWSPPNETLLESQLYHYDGEDKSQLKILLNVNDIDETCGPFTFLPATQSKKLQSGNRHSKRLTDELVDSVVGPDAAIRLTGPAGDVAAVDTSRCLHYGSRGNSRERLILMAQFTRFLAPKAHAPSWQVPGMESMGEAQRMALNSCR